MTTCHWIGGSWHSKGTLCLCLQGSNRSSFFWELCLTLEGEGTMFFSNIRNHSPTDRASYPSKPEYLDTLLWEPNINHILYKVPANKLNTAGTISGPCSMYGGEEKWIHRLGGETQRKETTVGRTTVRWILEMWLEGMDFIHMAQARDELWACLNMVINLRIP